MQQHGTKYFARRSLPNYPIPDPGNWSHLVKGQFFQNMVTSYIKLKIITNLHDNLHPDPVDGISR